MQRWLVILGVFWAGYGAATVHAGGTIEGTVKLPRTATVPSGSARYQIKASGPVSKPEPPKAVVYLEGDFGVPTNKPAVLRLGQKGYQFEQGILPIQKGATVEFPNFDDDYHNVFSYSKVKRFDLGRYKKDEKPASQKFDKTGVVKLYCEIHEHMRSTILVLDTPFFEKTDAEGKFRLENVPAGKYKLKAWLDEKVLEQSVEVKNHQTTYANFQTN